MANQVDDMSADPARGMLEPERASVEPLGSAELLIRSSATKRSARPASGGNAAKPAPIAKPSRAKANDPPAASEATSKLDRTPIRARTAHEAAAPDHGARTASPAADAGKAGANGPAGAQPTVLRQGLPRTGAYRASAVTRSLHPTPVATPIVAVTPAGTTPVATPMLGEGIQDIATADPRASDDAARSVPNDRAAPTDVAVAEPMGAATASAPPAESQTAAAETAELPSIIVEFWDPSMAHVDTAGAPIVTATDTRAAIESSESESLPYVIVEISDPQIASAEAARAPSAMAATSARPAKAASTWTDAGSTARITRPRSMRVGLGLLGAAVLGGAILGAALSSSRNEVRRDPRSALPAAANLVHALSGPPAPAAEVAPPPPVTPSPAAKIASPPAVSPPRPAEVASPLPSAPPPANAKPATPSATREPVRAVKPAPPPRPAPAKPLSFDPDALFLPKP